MKFFKSTISILLMLFVAVSAVVAQGGQQGPPMPQPADTVSDGELQKFVKVTDSAQSIQKDIQSQVQTLVEDEGMEFSRFQEIMMSKQNPQASGEVQTNPDEEKTIKSIQPQLMKIQQQAQQQFVQLIQDEGLSPQRFQQIMRAVQTNPEMQQRLQEMQSQ